jgi:hypothetical protein
LHLREQSAMDTSPSGDSPDDNLVDGESPVLDIEDTIPEVIAKISTEQVKLEATIEGEQIEEEIEEIEVQELLPIYTGGEAVLPNLSKREQRKQQRLEKRRAESERLRGLALKVQEQMAEEAQRKQDEDDMAHAADAWGDGSKDKSSSQANQSAKVDRYSMRYMLRSGVKYKHMMTSHQPRKEFWFEHRSEYFDEELSETNGRQEGWIDPVTLLAGGLLPLRNLPPFTPLEEIAQKGAAARARKLEKKRIRKERRELRKLRKEVKGKEKWAKENGVDLEGVDAWATLNEMELGTLEVWAAANEVDLEREIADELLDATDGEDPRYAKARMQQRLLQLDSMVEAHLVEGTKLKTEQGGEKSEGGGAAKRG